MVNIATLRPGLLVSLKTSIVGNAEYRRFTIEADHITEEGSRRAKWETERVILDPVERKRASETRSKCRALVSRVCSASTFGLLCPEDRRGELDDAVREAQRLSREFNMNATLTRVHVYVIAGRIAPDDEQAARAIASDVRGLLEEMEQAIQRLDVKAVRDAANRAKSMGQMLTPGAAERVKLAVDAARTIAKRIVKAGEESAAVIDQMLVKRITDSRTAFLDLDEQAIEVSAPTSEARAVDFEPELPIDVPVTGKTTAQPQIDLD
jgi:hypothetical protein